MSEFESLQKRLPNSALFSDLRSNNQIYVDKTDLIYKLAATRTAHFLSRPRRFGKTTIVSTLKELFLHGVRPYDGHDSYFKGLKIEKLWKDDSSYVVLHLDLAAINRDCRNSYSFKKRFIQVLAGCAKSYGISFDVSSYLDPDFLLPTSCLEDLIKAAGENKVVLLIDEYDAPLSQYIANKADFDEISNMLADIFGVIKDNPNYLRSVFVTGITRFKDARLLTQGNTVEDVSAYPEYGTLCGLTLEELKFYFSDYINYYTAKLFNCKLQEVDNKKTAVFLDKLTAWYDGYSFDENGDTHVFSIWSVLKFFSRNQTKFTNFWFDGGNMSKLLENNISKINLDDYADQILQNEICVSQEDFLRPSSIENMRTSVLLYQTGYLTLKKGYSNEGFGSPVTLCIPNLELKQSLAAINKDKIFKFKHNNSPSKDDLLKIMKSLNAEKLADFFSLILSGNDYEGNPICSEAMAAALIKTYLEAIGFDILSNAHQLSGRCDALIKCDEHFSIAIEYKYTDSDSDAVLNKKLDQAITQMQDHDYGHTLKVKNSTLWQVALVFSNKARKFAKAATVSVLPPFLKN